MTPDPVWSTTSGPTGAPQLVLVHGSLDRSAGMVKLARRLEARFQVTIYDRRGYGKSMPHDGPFGIDEQIADLIDVVGRAGPAGRPCVLFGHSYGGNVALSTAEREPELVAGVAVYETPLAWLPWWPGTTAGADATAWAHDPPGAAERFMRRMVGDARWERLPAATREARRAEGPALLGEMIDLRREPPWSPERIKAPVLAMHGEGAQEHHRTGMQTLNEWFGCEVITIAGARHAGPNTHPDEVAAVLVDFATRCFNRLRGA